MNVDGSKGHSQYDFSRGEMQRREAAILTAIQEVELNTPDSITLAIATLKTHSVKIPIILEKLEHLHAEHFFRRDERFHDECNDLRNQVLEHLRALIH